MRTHLSGHLIILLSLDGLRRYAPNSCKKRGYEYWQFLSLFATIVDKNMLDIKSLNYASDRTVLFQRSTVLLTEILLLIAVLHFTRMFPFTTRFASSGGVSASNVHHAGMSIVILAAANAGLFITDHVHFQYNGMLLGLLLLSISCISKGQDLMGSLLFAVLVNMKHLYLSLAPAYFVYLLRHHCISPHPTFFVFDIVKYSNHVQMLESGFEQFLVRLHKIRGAWDGCSFSVWSFFGSLLLCWGFPLLETDLRTAVSFRAWPLPCLLGTEQYLRALSDSGQLTN